ncbi:MAG: CsbD family protein [Polyangiaceae bacterium]
MNWDALKGDWTQLKGKAKQKWAKLTDDDLKLVEGKAEELIGRLQHHYGYKRDQAEREVDTWMESVNKPKQP